jgi:molybdenum cofactor biosynthesis enzyme MoaA
MEPIKINTVVMRGVNDDEIEDLSVFAGRTGVIFALPIIPAFQYSKISTANEAKLFI